MICEICHRIFNHRAFDIDGKCACFVCHLSRLKKLKKRKNPSNNS